MLRRALPFILAGFVIAPALAQTTVRSPTTAQGALGAQAQASYFPERLDWQQKTPEDVGMNGALLKEAVQLVLEANRALAEEAVAGEKVIKETLRISAP